MAGNDDVVVLINGAPYTGWLSIDVTQTYDKATGDGKLRFSPQPGRPMPIHVGDKAVILCAGQPVMTGHVHEIESPHDEDTHELNATIRDKTQDAIDSTIGPGNEFKPPVKLKSVMDKTLKKMGLGSIQVVDEANPEEFGPTEVPVGAVDDHGFDFFDKWTSKRQVVLGTDGKGNFVIRRNDGKKRGPGMLYKSADRDDPMNNVKKAKYKNSDFGRHNQVNVATQKSHNDMDYWESKGKDFAPGQADPLAKKWHSAKDTAVRSERKLHARGHEGHDGKSGKKNAKWRSNLARARGFEYTATVQGFEMSPGELWWPGWIIPVFDEHYDISDEMLVANVKFHKDWKGGSVTEVSVTFNDAFSESDEASPSRTAKRGIGGASSGDFDASDDLD